MTSGEVRVDTSDLTAKAGQVEGLTWANQAAQPPLVPPDTLMEANTAILNLANNAEGLWNFQEYGRLEGLRLAETLKLVADAYDRVDLNAMQDINNGSEGTRPSEVPGVNKLPEPPAPAQIPIPKGQLVDDGLLVPDVQTNLLAGDQAASLRAAAAMWRQNATSLETSAQGFEVSSVNWEGEAADAAYRKFNDYRAWLVSLSGSWNRLADEADRVAQAHFTTLNNHQPIYDEFMRLQAEFFASKNDQAKQLQIATRMAELQKASDEVRWQYAAEGQPNQVQPEDPPRGASPTTPVTTNGDPRQPAGSAQDGETQASGGGGTQSPGGQAPMQGAPMSPAASPASAQSGGQESGSAPSGGQESGGGQPSGGGGAPSGGAPSSGGVQSGGESGGSPGGGPQRDGPKLPTDPSLRPAAASGGGGSGAGGGAGGGVPTSPLSAPVTAETVAPAPIIGAGPGPSTAAATNTGGMMGGGMGMAPMHAAGMGGQQQDKKRNPAVAQDEDLYTEDRPWTEAVIGNRRRRGTQEEKESQ